MENNRTFKGIWVPKELWFNKELTLQEKIIFIEIDSLEDEELGCFASNKHFVSMFGITSSRVSQIIQSLQKKEYITIEYKYNGKEITSRHIKINKNKYPKDRYVNSLNTYVKNINGVCQNDKGGYVNLLKDNNTYINNTNLSNTIKDIVDYLNSRINTNYKSSSKKTQSLINARLNEGFTLEDFKKVIDKKVLDWGNDKKMSLYLRPETLFGTKFESYLNQPVKKRTLKDIKLEELERF